MSLQNSFRVFVLMTVVSFVALADDYYVDITNNTGYTIEYMYVSPGNTDEWQEDLLGEQVLPNGAGGRVTLTGFSGPIFDIRLEDEEGDTYTFWDFNVEEFDLVVTPEDID